MRTGDWNIGLSTRVGAPDHDTVKIPRAPFTLTDWNSVPSTVHKGKTGEAIWRTTEVAELRIRMVEYSPGYTADHWCDRGHVLLVLEGELVSEISDGRSFTLTKGMSYHVSDHRDASHRSSTKSGAKLFIVD